jgi:hypothetical protein
MLSAPLQTTLDNYKETNQGIYQILKDTGYVDNHKAQILATLFDLKMHNSDEIASLGGKQYNARILELRRDGWDIVSIRSGLKFFFKLREQKRRWEK